MCAYFGLELPDAHSQVLIIGIIMGKIRETTTASLLVFFVLLFSLSHFIVKAKETNKGKAVITKANCSLAFLPDKISRFPLLDANETVSFWNHLLNYPGEYSSAKSSHGDYGLRQVTENKCYQAESYSIILVKKIINWKRQHGNGIEIKFEEESFAFGDYNDFNIRLRLNSHSSYFPRNQKVRAVLPAKMSNEILNELDDSNAYIGFTFYGENHADNDKSTFYQDIIVKIPADLYLDTWLDISVPLTSFSTYSQKNYQKHPIEQSQITKDQVFGLLITAETKNGKTLRHYLRGDFPDNAPEILKETSIGIEKISLTL